MLQAVESCPAQGCCESEAKKHRIQQDKARDCRVRVLEQNHQADQPDCGTAEIQLARGVVGERHADDAKHGVEGAHESVIHILRVLLAGLELKRSVVASKIARKAHKHLPERGMHIKVELALQVVGSELSKARRC